MPRKPPPTADQPDRGQQLLEALGQLNSLVEERLAEQAQAIAEIKDHIEHMCEVVRENTERLGVIEDIFEEMRIDTEWACRNLPPEPFRLTSFPIDPAASDWAERVNRYSGADLPDMPESAAPGSTAPEPLMESSARSAEFTQQGPRDQFLF